MTTMDLLSIADVNQMTYDDFVDRFGNIVQAAKWVTASVWSLRPFVSLPELHQRVCDVLDSLPLEVKEGALRGLPDLAGREAKEIRLGCECNKEQKSAGLLQELAATKRQQIRKYNAYYKTRFGFPFVLCARENKVDSVLVGFRNRIGNSREVEVQTGINEIKKICWYRLCDIVKYQAPSAQVQASLYQNCKNGATG